MRGRKPNLRLVANPVGGCPPPPSWMAPAAQAEWRRVVPVLVERRVLTVADYAALENFCVLTGRARQAEAAIQSEEDPETLMKWIRLQDKAMCSARLYANELGLTPVSRSRPAIDGDDDADSLLD